MATTKKVATTEAAAVSHAKPAKAKPTKQEAAAAAVAKMRQASLAIAPIAAPSELVMMPLSLIEAHAQVRKDFDEDALAELAADVATRGVLQPVLLRPAPGRANFVLIAGERRFRAAKLAGLDCIPAIVGNVDDDTASAMQIAENIQRADLTLQEEAAAIRKLYELTGNSVTDVATKLHKSKAWVSKRLAASCPDLRLFAKEILEGGFSEDLEIILILDKFQQLDWCGCRDLCEKIKKGEAGRQTVREAYEAAKKIDEERKAKQAEPQQETDEERAKREASRQQWDAARKAEAEQRRIDPMNIRWRYNKELADDERAILEKHLRDFHHNGGQKFNYDFVHEIVWLTNNGYAGIEMAAFAAGNQGVTFDLAALIETTAAAEQEDGE